MNARRAEAALALYRATHSALAVATTRALRHEKMNDASPVRRPRCHPAGFTLLELTVVLVILALVGGLVLTRAPSRGGTIDLRAATSLVAGTLRVARTRAIAANRPVPVRFDPADAALQLGADPVRRLPPGVRIAAADLAILFRPDGSSSGGTVDLAGGASTARIAVNWLTGRVAIAGATAP